MKHNSLLLNVVAALKQLMMSVYQSKAVVLVLLDLSAAFETINHDVLFSRLEKLFGFQAVCLTGLHPV